MNIQLANVISDLSGTTGQAIVRAILNGERAPQKLAELRDRRIHATKEEIAKSLQGNWRPELLFIVRQQLEMYEAYQRQIAECDQQLQEHLASFAGALPSVDGGKTPQSKKSKRYRYMPQFPLSNELMRISGIDLTQIDGVDAMTAQI
jgi:hypothetical protein